MSTEFYFWMMIIGTVAVGLLRPIVKRQKKEKVWAEEEAQYRRDMYKIHGKTLD